MPLAFIGPPPLPLRHDLDGDQLRSLARSIATHGLLHPILIQPNPEDGPEQPPYVVIAGERRRRAAQLAGLDEISAALLPALTSEQTLQLALVENLQRADLNPIEEALAFTQLLAAGLDQKQVAELAGRSQPAIANALRLLQLPDDVQHLIRRGSLTAAHGRALLRWHHLPAVATAIAQHAIDHQVPTKELERGLPQGASEALTKSGLAIEVSTWQTPWYDRHCKKCPLDARAAASTGWVGRTQFCLRPDHWQELDQAHTQAQETARQERQAQRARAAAPADPAGGDAGPPPPPPLDDLQERGETIRLEGWPFPAPDCLAGRCPCYVQALDDDGDLIAVCTDKERFSTTRNEYERAIKTDAAQAHAHDLARLTAHLDTVLDITAAHPDGLVTSPAHLTGIHHYARELALVAAALLSDRVHSPDTIEGAFTAAGIQAIKSNRRDDWHAPAVLDLLLANPPRQLLRLAIELITRSELEWRYDAPVRQVRYHEPRDAARARWYFGATDQTDQQQGEPSSAPSARPASAGISREIPSLPDEATEEDVERALAEITGEATG